MLTRELFEKTIEKFGKIDCLINNAGLIAPLQQVASYSSGDLEQVETTFATNITSVIQLTNLALPWIRKSQGTILFMSSGAALRPMMGWSVYCSSKAALHMFCQCLALEEASNHVKCVNVRPGVVETEMIQTVKLQGKSVMSEQDYQRIAEEKGVVISAEESAKHIAALAYYCTDELSGKFVSYKDEIVLEFLKKQE